MLFGEISGFPPNLVVGVRYFFADHDASGETMTHRARY